MNLDMGGMEKKAVPKRVVLEITQHWAGVQ